MKKGAGASQQFFLLIANKNKGRISQAKTEIDGVIVKSAIDSRRPALAQLSTGEF